MQLPPDIMNKCLRCRADLSATDETCRSCGADPALERQIWVQSTAAVRELRWLFLALLALNTLVSWLVYDQLQRSGFTSDASQIAISGAIVCGAMAVLWFAAARAPIMAASIALAIFAFDWVREILRDRVWALDPVPLGIRAFVVIALGFALRRGLAARRLRAQRSVAPTAVALSGA